MTGEEQPSGHPVTEWNWYLPRWLEWLPSLSPEAAAETVEAAPTAEPV